MTVHDWNEGLSGGACAMAVGVFDGVHVGHRALLARLKQEASGLNARPVVLTFRRNPRRIVQGEGYPGDVQTLDQKVETLDEQGVEALVLADFAPPFTELSGLEFLEALKTRFGVRCLVMGENTRMGAGGALRSREAADAARSLGMEAMIVSALSLRGRPVSSSLIRSSILEGEMGLAAALLGRPWELDSSSWERVSALLRRTDGALQALPPTGRYAFASPSGDSGSVEFRRFEGSAEMIGVGVQGLPDRLRFV